MARRSRAPGPGPARQSPIALPPAGRTGGRRGAADGRRAMRRAGLSLLLALAGCAGNFAPGGVAGIASGEGCRPQLASYDGAADTLLGERRGFFRAGLPQPPWQRPGPAAGSGLQADLAQENADLDSVQIAFDSLLYCRWIEARTVRADLAARRIARPEAEQRMAALRARLRRDLDKARQVLARLEAQSREREPALESAAPGVRTEAARARAARGQASRAVAAATVPLRLRPDQAAPEIGRVPQGQAVSLRPAASGFAYIEGAALRGYAPAAAFQAAERTPPAAAPGGGGELRRLAATNLAKRDNFAESIQLAENAAVSGFELGT